MLRCFVLLREQVPRARLLIVNRDEHARIAATAAAHGIAPGELELVAASHAEVPALIARMSAAMALIRPSYSKIASAPTKLGEYLGCGVPCLGNAGVGDVEELLEGRRVGVAVRDFSDQELGDGVNRLIALAGNKSVQQRCRDTALELFSLERGVESYRAIYRELGAAA